MDDYNELVSFLGNANPSIRRIAVTNLKGLTGSDEGRMMLAKANAAEALCRLLGDLTVSYNMQIGYHCFQKESCSFVSPAYC